MNVNLTAITATSATLGFTAVPAGTLVLDVQYCNRPDFSWAPAPILRSPSLSAMTLGGLNQYARYYIRARPVSNTGVPGDWSDILGIFTPVSALRDPSPASVMIEPALLIPPAPVLQWACENEQPGFPVRSLGRDEPNSTWMSSRVGLVFAIEARIAPTPVDSIAVLATNASEACTITIKAGANQANVRGGSPSFTYASRPFRASAGLPGRRSYHSFVRLPAAQSFPYWRLEIGGPVPGDIFVATYAVLGLAHSTRNFVSDSKTETLLDMGSIDRDRSGNPARVLGHRGRTVNFDIENITEAQYETAFEQLRWHLGTTEPALVVPNSKAGPFLHDRLLFGTMSADKATNTFSPRFAQSFQVSSLI